MSAISFFPLASAVLGTAPTDGPARFGTGAEAAEEPPARKRAPIASAPEPVLEGR